MGVAVLGLGAVLVGVPTVIGGVAERAGTLTAIEQVPRDNPGLGLVYDGLAPAKANTPCVGAYEVTDRQTCSHGPDQPPPGLNVKRAVAPVARTSPVPTLPRRDTGPVPAELELLDDEAATAPEESSPALAPDAAPGGGSGAGGRAAGATGPGGVRCDGDGVAGNRIQALYVYEAGSASRYSQYLASFRTWAAGVDAIFDASAKQTGGSRHLRYVTTADCEVDVPEVQVPAGSLKTFTATVKALKKLGHHRTDRKYLLFADTRVYCGIGTFVRDDDPGRTNGNNRGPSYGRTDAGCWSAAVAAHELAHTLGGVQHSAPNASRSGHCVDDHDIMCYKDAATTALRVACRQRGQEQRLDCNHDDYFHTDPEPGSYLAEHWNVADSAFLLRGDVDGAGGSPDPRPTPASPTGGAPTATRGPAPTGAAPTPAATPTTSAPPGGPAGGGDTSSSSGTGPGGAGPGDTGPDGTGSGAGPDAATRTPGPDATPPGGTDTDTRPPAAGAAPTTAPPAEPTADDPPVQVSGTTSTAMRLGWPAARPDTRYTVVLDGRALGSTTATSVRVIGLRPDAAYRLRVATTGADGRLTPHTTEATVRTPTAGRPSVGGWFRLGNSLTGGTAQVYGARGADGTPLVLGRTDGATNQHWRLQPAGGDRYLLMSRATGKCMAPLGAVAAGAVLVQRPCAAQDSAQQWEIQSGDHGYAVVSAEGGLTLGVSRLRYGGQRLLVLQEADGLRYQSWSAAPA